MAPKIILITGGNRGIGFGIVQALTQRSVENTLIVASRKRDDAEEAIAEAERAGCQNPFYPLALDVTSNDSIMSAVAEVKRAFGRLDSKLYQVRNHLVKVC